jgi:UDPglucose 6-dehydrogenase
MAQEPNKQQSVGVIGGGVLGKAVARGFMEMCEVRVYDLDKSKCTHTADEASSADIVFICLPTPAKPDGRCETLHVEAFLESAEEHGNWNADSCYVIRSTVPVGFTHSEAEKRDFKLPLFHSPEFLTARCAITDFQTPARNIIGYPRGAFSLNNEHVEGCVKAIHRLRDLYEQRFPGVPVMSMPSDASELVKLASNSFFAAKVTLFNLFHDLAEARKLEWQQVLQGILSDGRIAHAHTTVPGPDGKLGFGGACLAKDTADLFRCCEAAGVDAAILRAVIERNEQSRGPHDESLTRVDLSYFK